MSAGRLFRWSAFAWSGVGLLLLAALPAVAVEGFGNPRLPAVIHAFTLGAFVNGYYALQPAVWTRVYRQAPPWPGLSPAIWALHQAGLILMLAGFLRAGLAVAHIGAHYLIPTGMVLHALQGALALRRRPPGTPRHLGSHVPLLGMLAAMALGAMIILDQTTGRYGLYNPPTLLVHGMAGAFLFLLPALRLHGAVEGAAAEALEGATAGLLLRTAPLVLAVLTMAAGLVPGAQGIALPGGLALLGAALLWGALPTAQQMAPRPVTDPLRWMEMAWGLPGLLLLFAALRSLRGMAPAEALRLAALGAAAVVLVAGLPELIARLTSKGAERVPPRGFLTPRAGGLLMAAAGLLVLAGQWLAAGPLVQVGAVGSSIGLILAVLNRGRRPDGPAAGARTG